MGCFRRFSLKIKKNKGERRHEGPAPASPAAASFPSTVSTAARSNLSFSTVSSAVGTSQSEDSCAAVRPAASKSSGSVSVSSARSIPELYEERGANSLREFGFRELRAATSDFSRLLKVGEGGFGSVYKGVVRLPGGPAGGTVVAIKRLNPNGHQGHKQWLAEVHFLGVVEHPNLVKLIGYCAAQSERGPQRLLVYEFVSNKTLDDHLFNRAYPVLPWDIRLEIALGAAEGLLYLHDGLEVQVIYRDFKASNVLLDEEFRAKLSDFGLAREGPSAGHTHVSTAVMGTFGYAAPDYVETGHLTAKSDVWSFGVVLYEILTGRRSMERNRPKNEQKLLEWVRQYPVESKRFSKIIDKRLEGHYSKQGTREIARLANSCLAKHGKDRPTMREVVESLKQAMQHKEPDGDVGASGDSSPPHEASGKPTAEDVAVASARRRMLHLAALGENANSIARRRFMFMRAAAARTPT
ncbi:probable serine/threonine-protein kinase PBL19 [Phragmites australis]|uniref:probable serine/threonine-protein kinase PBL19 n=1 Tax=Phragmites australis TaxID=29695 RepID=UPI002D77709B|nr:probable serine/threonine-protein kinase PBL19 [Phragmites australis]